MPTYRIHRLKDHLRQQVRFAPHVSGTALVKPRDYQPATTGGQHRRAGHLLAGFR